MITKRRHILVTLSTALLLGAVAMPAHAKPGKWKAHPHQNGAYQTQQNYAVPNRVRQNRAFSAPRMGYVQIAQNRISAAEAKAIARRRVKGGEVVDIARKGDTYRVRVIAKNGQVVDVLIDANSGRVKR